ncbi:MAG TPA: hypothetical protein VK923_07230 [Euzebyales bacterium]|nr:hypothetical protein [Euzebyales bacterium]
MQRVAVIGNCGGGRTHVSRGLGTLLGIRVIHLDAGHLDATLQASPEPGRRT